MYVFTLPSSFHSHPHFFQVLHYCSAMEFAGQKKHVLLKFQNTVLGDFRRDITGNWLIIIFQSVIKL